MTKSSDNKQLVTHSLFQHSPVDSVTDIKEINNSLCTSSAWLPSITEHCVSSLHKLEHSSTMSPCCFHVLCPLFPAFGSVPY